MANSTIGKRLKHLTVLGVVVAGLAATIGHSSDEGYEAHIRKRAERVFEHDRKHGDLPSNRLYALSIALKFGDVKGAEVLVSSLEKKMQGI